MSEHGSAGGLSQPGEPPAGGWNVPPPGPYGGPGAAGPYPQQPTPHPGWAPDGFPAGPPKTHGKATAILVLGLSSWVCLGIPGIVALCMAPGVRREIAASRGRLTGERLIKVGVICSWIFLALTVLFVVMAIIAVANIEGDVEIQIPGEPAIES